jgi:diguanylate cyclase (GGDEF)-like protein
MGRVLRKGLKSNLHNTLDLKLAAHRAASVAFLAFLFATSSGVLLLAQSQPAVLPTLTTTRAAHQLTVAESRRAYAVRLRAVVTYYDPYIDPHRPLFFVSDSTGSIYVGLSVTPAVPLKTGQLVEVTGVSGPGDFAPIVERSSVRVIGDSHLPSTAPHVSMTRLLTGDEDGQWVEVEGVVHAVVESARKIVFKLALSDGDINATTMREQGADYQHFVDAKILLRGNTGPLFNHRRQMTGWSLLFPGLATVKVEEPVPLRPFASSAVPLNGLLSYSPNIAFRHRVHIRGVVTLFWPGRMLCLQDGPQGLCAQTAQTTPLQPGESADVIGFPAVGEFNPILTDANYKASGGWRPVPPLAVTAAQALSGDHDAELVEIVGQVIGEDRAAKDPSILLSSGKLVFSLIRSGQSWPEASPTLEEGATLRVTGICSVQSSARENRGGFLTPKSFRILLRSPEDIVVVGRPSWWNAAHTLRVLALALLIIVLTAVALFRQVRRGIRTASELRRAQEATRCALEQMEHQAHHDPLTGLANRLMFDKSILSALDLAERTRQRVGLIYLDLDRFKVINDTLGHAAGDIVLRQAAERLTSASPQDSLLARLGGDEFALLLPGISSRVQAEAVGQGIVKVLAAPYKIDGMPWHCPGSIGLSLFPEDAEAAAALQRSADTALYRAKRASPGQLVTFNRSMSEQAERSVLLENALRRALE